MVIEIPSDSEAEVRVLELKEESRERFLAQHSELLAAYDETQVKFRKNSADPKQMIRGQGHLFNAVATRFKEPAMRRQLKLLPEIKIGSQIDLREENKSLACDESIPSTTVEELAKTVAAFTSRFDSMENEIASSSSLVHAHGLCSTKLDLSTEQLKYLSLQSLTILLFFPSYFAAQ